MNKNYFQLLLSIILVGLFSLILYMGLSSHTAADTTQINISSQTDWEQGSVEEIDFTTSPGSILIDNNSEKKLTGGVWHTDGDGSTSNLENGDTSDSSLTIETMTEYDGVGELAVKDYNREVEISKIRFYRTGCEDMGFYSVGYYDGPMEDWSWESHIVYGDFDSRSFVDEWTNIISESTCGTPEPGIDQWTEYSLDSAVQGELFNFNISAPLVFDYTTVKGFELYGKPLEAHHTTAPTQIDCGENIESWDSFTAIQTTPANTDVQYQFRTSSDGTTWSDWTAAVSYSEAIDLSSLTANRYLQIKTTLSTTEATASPSVDEYEAACTVSSSCANIDHLEYSDSQIDDTNLSPDGGSIDITAHAVDDEGSYINTDFTFSLEPEVGTLEVISASGETGEASWTWPAGTPAGEYTLSVSACGETHTNSFIIPEAGFDHLSLTATTSADKNDAEGGDKFCFTARAKNVEGEDMSTTFNFSEDIPGVGMNVTQSTGTKGTACVTLPSDIEPGDYQVCVSSLAGGKECYQIKVKSFCADFDKVKLNPAGGVYQAGRRIALEGYGVDDDGNRMPGAVNYSLSGGGGGYLDGNYLVMPKPGERVVLTASHNCGSRSFVFNSTDFDCDKLDRIELKPNQKTIYGNQPYTFNVSSFKVDGEEYGYNQIDYLFTSTGGEINSSGTFTPPNKGGEFKVKASDAFGCGVSDSSLVKVISQDQQKGFITFPDFSNGGSNNDDTIFAIIVDPRNYLGEGAGTIELNPRLEIEGEDGKRRDVTDYAEVDYRLVDEIDNDNSFDEAGGKIRLNDPNQAVDTTIDINFSYYPLRDPKSGNNRAGNYQKTVRVIVNPLSCYTPTGEPCEKMLNILKPDDSSSWQLGDRETISWTTPGLDEFIQSIRIEYIDEDDPGTKLVDEFPNTGEFDWNIPDDNNFTSDQAKIKITAKNNGGGTFLTNQSANFKIGDETSDLIPGLSLRNTGNEIKTQLATQGPMVGLALASLTWPYLIGALGSNGFGLLSNFLGYLFQNLLLLFSSKKKRRQKWGTVYDYDDKTPVAYAKIMLFDAENDKLKDSYITNSKGEFGFDIPKEGQYYLVVEKAGYSLADDAKEKSESNRPGERGTWRPNISDSYYTNLYFGQMVKIEEGETLKLSIPLRMRDKTWLTGILSILRKISDFFYLVRIPILIIGTLLAIYLLLSQRTILDIIVLGIYIIFWLLELLKTKQIRGYGLVTDSKGKGLELTMVRAYSKEGKLIQTKITGPQGKFNLSLDPQEVILKIKKPGYQPRIVEFELKSIKDISNLTIRLESNESVEQL